MRKKHHPEYPTSQRPHAFLLLAYQFHEAFERCRDFNSPNIPGYFLACQTVELALKSYLLRQGIPIEDIVNYGHDIKRLLMDSLNKGLTISTDDEFNITAISKMHFDTFDRYPMEIARPIYLIEQAEQAIENLLRSVDPYRVNSGKENANQPEPG